MVNASFFVGSNQNTAQSDIEGLLLATFYTEDSEALEALSRNLSSKPEIINFCDRLKAEDFGLEDLRRELHYKDEVLVLKAYEISNRLDLVSIDPVNLCRFVARSYTVGGISEFKLAAYLAFMIS